MKPLLSIVALLAFAHSAFADEVTKGVLQPEQVRSIQAEFPPGQPARIGVQLQKRTDADDLHIGVISANGASIALTVHRSVLQPHTNFSVSWTPAGQQIYTIMVKNRGSRPITYQIVVP